MLCQPLEPHQAEMIEPHYLLVKRKPILELSSRVGRKIPQELTHFSPRSHPGHLVGKRTAQNKTTPKISQATARRTPHFPCRWSPASLHSTSIFFYLFSTFKLFCYYY